MQRGGRSAAPGLAGFERDSVQLEGQTDSVIGRALVS